MKNDFGSSKHYRTLCGKCYANACVTLNACTAPAVFVLHSFLLASFLDQTSKDCIENTEHSNVNVNAECNEK